jgi:pectate lyase
MMTRQLFVLVLLPGLSLLACGGGEPEALFEVGAGKALSLAVAPLPVPVGFGRATTGGAGGAVCRVTSLADAGTGTLRDCASRAAAHWVLFDVSGEILLKSMVNVASNKTIDGRGRKVRLKNYGLRLYNVRNVVIENLQFEDGAGDNEDAIQIFGGTQHVVIDHCSLSRFTDGLLDITRQATDVTVSWNRFYDHDKVMLIGASVEDTADSVIRVTLHHNAFIDTVQRHPRLRYGRVHAYNNYYKNWDSYGIGASQDGQVLSEANIFEAGANRTAVQSKVGEDPRPGFVKSSGDWKLNGAVIAEREPTKVFNPRSTYGYTAEKADSALRSRLQSTTGWQLTPFPLP